MPVSLETFEHDEIPDVPSVIEKSLAFLYANSNKAYTSAEVADAISEDVDKTDVMLVRLLRQDIVRTKNNHWAIVEDTGQAETMYDIETALNFMELDG